MADTKISAASLPAAPAFGDRFAGAQGSTSYAMLIDHYIGLITGLCQGRITLATGVPITTTDQTGKSVVYFTPYNGNLISLYGTGSGPWKARTFAEKSVTLSGLTSGKNYDLFGYEKSGDLAIDLGPTWNTGSGSDTARGTGAGSTELILQDGIWVNKVSITSTINSDTIAANAGRYLGTIRTTGTTTTESSFGGTTTNVGGKQFVFNMYNQVRLLAVMDTTNSWSYTTQTIRQARATAGNKIEFVCGMLGMPVEAQVNGFVILRQSSAHAAFQGIGVDSTSAISGFASEAYNGITTAVSPNGVGFSLFAQYSGYPGLGYHYLSWNEYGSDATQCDFFGLNDTDAQCGLRASFWG